MSTAGGLDNQSFIALTQLCDSVKHDTSIRRAETEERIALAKKRNLEREFGLKGSSNSLLAYSPKPYRTLPRTTPAKKSNRSRLVRDLSVPSIVYRLRRSADGLRSFHYSIEPIPKSAIFRALASGTKIGPGAGEARVRYTTGIDEGGYLLGDRVQSDLFGRPLIFSNISKEADEIASFFSLVEENERSANLDTARIEVDRHRDIWRRVVDDPACEPALVQAYRAIKGQGSIEVELSRGADALLKVMKRHGFVPADKAYPPERQDELNGMKLTKGRGGRIQWRIVVALPAEFSPRQRCRAVEAICQRLGRRGAMYAAVIHEPVATNHQNNFHAHIDVYDRPCRRLTGDERDLVHVGAKWQAKIKDELLSGKLAHLKGQWDFAAVREYRSSSGNRTLHKPFRAKKSGAFRAYSFPKRHRAEIAGIINAIAVAEGHGRLYNPRTYDAMKIAKEPDEQLGPKRHGLEAKGAPTDAGIRNEERHAKADRHLIETAYQRRLEEVAQQQRAFDLRCELQGEPGSERREARDQAHAALADLKLVVRARYLAELARLEMERQLSRPRNMIRAAGRAKRRGEDARGELAALGEEARCYWRDWQEQNHSALAELQQLSKFAAREGELQAASERLQAAALRQALPAVQKSGPAHPIVPWIAAHTGAAEALPVTPATMLESEAPLLLGKRFKRLMKQAHHGALQTKAEPRRNIMIKGPKLSNAAAQVRPHGSTEPAPSSPPRNGQTSAVTAVADGRERKGTMPIESAPDGATPALPGRHDAVRRVHADVGQKMHSADPVVEQAMAQPKVDAAQVEVATETRPAMQSPVASAQSNAPQKAPEQANSLPPRTGNRQSGEQITVEPAERSAAAKQGSADGSITPAPPLDASLQPSNSQIERLQERQRGDDHAKLIEAHLRKLEEGGVLFRKDRTTGEIVGLSGGGPPLSQTDELLLRWGGMVAEQLVLKQREMRQVQDYLLKHGEALARADKQPGPRCRRLMKKWEDEPKLQKTLEWFAAEQDMAKRKRAAELARHITNATLAR